MIIRMYMLQDVLNTITLDLEWFPLCIFLSNMISPMHNGTNPLLHIQILSLFGLLNSAAIRN